MLKRKQNWLAISVICLVAAGIYFSNIDFTPSQRNKLTSNKIKKRDIELSDMNLYQIKEMYKIASQQPNQTMKEFYTPSPEENLRLMNDRYYNTLVKYNFIDPNNIRDVDLWVLRISIRDDFSRQLMFGNAQE